MGGWRGDASTQAPTVSPARPRRSENHSQRRGTAHAFTARRDSVKWVDALKPVKDFAAKGENKFESLHEAVKTFFSNVKTKGIPNTDGVDKTEVASDVLTLVRAVNRFVKSVEKSSEDDSELKRFVTGVDALVSDLIASDLVALDAEVVNVLGAYYITRLTGEEKDSEAYKVIQALAQEGGELFLSSELEQLVSSALTLLSSKTSRSAGEESNSAMTTDNTTKHALGALGALVRNAKADVLSTDTFHAVGEVLVILLEADKTYNKNKATENANASRVYASLWRCLHLCASMDGGFFPEPTLSSVLSHAKRFLSYGLGNGGSGADNETVATENNAPPLSPSKGGYVPPHQRSQYPSDSETSDTDNTFTSIRVGDKFGSLKVRLNAAAAIAALAKADPRSVHQHWPLLLPTSTAQTLPRSPQNTLAKVLLNDPSPRVRAAAAQTIAALFESAVSRQYLVAAEVLLDKKTGLPKRRVNFASLSSTLGDIACATHHALVRAVQTEPHITALPSVCKALSVFTDTAPFQKLPHDLLPETLSAAWKRLLEVSEHSSVADEGDVVSATVALLSVLGATLGAKGAPRHVSIALGAKEANASVLSKNVRPTGDLTSLLPGLAHLAYDPSNGIAVRCEAFGALRHAASVYVDAVASVWDDVNIQRALPGAIAGDQKQESTSKTEKSESADRAAHASARFLSEYLLHAAGGGAAAAAAAAASAGDNDKPSGSGTKNSEKTNSFVLSVDALVVLWTQVASSHFPAMTRHANALVRASGIGALGGVTSSALAGLSDEHRNILRSTPRHLIRNDDSAAVRAAACRALGALAALPLPDFGENKVSKISTTSDASLLISAMKDGSKSVRLPASWAIANLCCALWQGVHVIDSKTLRELAAACVDAATREGDKVRANAARALGHIIAVANFSENEGSQSACTWLPSVTHALMSCLTTGNAKTQWNACIAIHSLFSNETSGCESGTWSPLIIRMCLMLVRDSPNVKLRTHCAATLAAPPNRDAFGNAYADVVSVIVGAVEAGFNSDEGGDIGMSKSDGSPARSNGSHKNAQASRAGNISSNDFLDPDAVRHAPRLAARLVATLLRVVSFGTPQDASSVRGTLLKKRNVLRKVLQTSKLAVQKARDETSNNALPEDPFGVQGKAQENSSYDELAVGGDTSAGAALSTGTPQRTSSMDVSALAEALSPSKSPSKGGKITNDERTNGHSNEIEAATRGLSRMYRALGGDVNEQEAAFYETV